MLSFIFIMSILVWTISYTLIRVGLVSKSVQDFFENLKNIERVRVLIYARGAIAFNCIYLLLGYSILALILSLIVSVIIIVVLERCI